MFLSKCYVSIFLFSVLFVFSLNIVYLLIVILSNVRFNIFLVIGILGLDNFGIVLNSI